MVQTQSRKYKDFTSVLAGERVSLPYSGEYENPVYQSGSSDIVHGYDIGGTLASAEMRDIVIRNILGLEIRVDIKNLLSADLRQKANKREITIFILSLLVFLFVFVKSNIFFLHIF